MAVFGPTGACGAALYMGTCSGHGTGTGSSHHPGLGGGILGGCPHPALTPMVVPKPVSAMDATTMWPPTSQLPNGPTVTDVVINGKIPIVDQDILTPHPTPTQHATSSAGYKCFVTRITPACHCTVGVAGGREAAAGHSRKLMATSKTVFINSKRAGRIGDPLGDKSPAFPCNSVVAGGSPNVYVGM